LEDRRTELAKTNTHASLQKVLEMCDLKGISGGARTPQLARQTLSWLAAACPVEHAVLTLKVLLYVNAVEGERRTIHIELHQRVDVEA
jgi:hypothetical protein